MDTPVDLQQLRAEVREWPTVALGRLIETLRPAVEAGQAGPASELALGLVCDVLAERKTVA